MKRGDPGEAGKAALRPSRKMNLFYTQGDYGLLQCARNCSGETYGNERQVREMVAARKTSGCRASSFPAAHTAGRLWSLTCVSTELSARTADGTRRLPATARSARHTPAIASCIWSWALGQHARHHQIPLLERRGSEWPCDVRLREHRRGVRSDYHCGQEHPRG